MEYIYVHCPFWLYLLTKCLKSPPSCLPLTRLGLVEPSRDSLLAVAASFAGYHAVKRFAAKHFCSACDLIDSQRLDLHRVFYDAFIAEANENGLSVIPLASALRTLH